MAHRTLTEALTIDIASTMNNVSRETTIVFVMDIATIMDTQ